jgi:hypothetical protein
VYHLVDGPDVDVARVLIRGVECGVSLWTSTSQSRGGGTLRANSHREGGYTHAK